MPGTYVNTSDVGEESILEPTPGHRGVALERGESSCRKQSRSPRCRYEDKRLAIYGVVGHVGVMRGLFPPEKKVQAQ